ncbi:MAG: phosphocholine cytidylyltransferase family protein, partial [Ignavibacteriales bacterium]|nr:phosphocholine cytidylyltransferase family protein [Ignavibacteriales bacterium]
MSRARQAVILAAGMGTRLRDQWQDLPKGFLSLGQKPIIEESIGKLIRCGIDEVIIVTGYQREKFEELARRLPFVKTVVNNDYETTGNMKSLSEAKAFVKGDFLLLEADLVYEFNALQMLQNTDHKNCVLLSGETFSGDEVFADVRNNRIVKFSKSRKDITQLGGELVGISRISLDLYKDMVAREVGTTGKYDYENCLSDISHVEKIEFEFVEDFAWCEIDDAQHLERSKNVVYPRVCERDSQVSWYRKTDREVLLNPGPATTTDSVKYAMITEDI